MLGKFNRLTAALGYQGAITGDGSDNAVNGRHFLSPCKLRLIGARISCTATDATAAKISVYQGSTKIVDQFTLTSTTKTGEMTLTAAMKDTIYDAGSEFSLKEETTATKTVTNLNVDLTFRVYEA